MCCCRVGGGGGRRHGVLRWRTAYVLLVLVLVTSMVHAKRTSDSEDAVVSTVKANREVTDDESENDSSDSASARRSTSSKTGKSSSNPFVFKANADVGVRSSSLKDTYSDVWDLLTTRTLQPESANEADPVSASSSSRKKTSTIAAESLSLSADDAVIEALNTATPAVETPAPVTTDVPVATLAPEIVTSAPVAVVTSAPEVVLPSTPAVVATSTPVAALTPTVTAAPVRTPTPTSTATPPPVQTTAPITLPESPPAAQQDELSSTASKGSLETDQLVSNANVKSGVSSTTFNETIIVIILGGVGVIAVAVLVMSKKISKETGDEEALRSRSSFGVMRL